MDGIDKHASVPLYRQLTRRLRDGLVQQAWQSGLRVPSERDLAHTYGISRMTVRGALRELIRDGVLYTVPGKGTFVARPPWPQEPNRLRSFRDEMQQRGLRPATRVLSQGIGAASGVIAARLDLHVGAPVLTIQRLHRADEQPISVETAYLDARRFACLQEDLAQDALHEVLAAHGLPVRRAEQWITATHAQAREATLLVVPERSALLCVEWTGYGVADQPLACVVSLYRGDRYRLNVRLEAPVPAQGEAIQPERTMHAHRASP